jgi:subtilisin family serine protease
MVWLLFGLAACPSVSGDSYPWNLQDQGINAVSAWGTFGVDGNGITVAIISTGVDYSLPDLSDQYLGGYDFGDNDSDPMGGGTYTPSVPSGGTNKASIILGKGIEVQGIAPKTKYYALKVVDSAGNCTHENIMRAVDWAINKKADIILLDYWSDIDSYTLNRRIATGYAGGNALFVGRAGDDPNQISPGVYTDVIKVGGYKQDMTLLDGQNPTGEEASERWRRPNEVVAPGENIPVLQAGGGTILYTRTSVAAAHVVGQLALMKQYSQAHQKGYNNSAFWETLNQTAEALNSGEPNKEGHGRADALKALEWIANDWYLHYDVEYLNPSRGVDSQGRALYLPGDQISYTVTVTSQADAQIMDLNVMSQQICWEGPQEGVGIGGLVSDRTSLAPGGTAVLGPYTYIIPDNSPVGLGSTQITLEVGQRLPAAIIKVDNETEQFQVIPEPASVTLMAMGALGLIARRRGIRGRR